MNSIVKKPTKLIELCAECAEISQNKVQIVFFSVLIFSFNIVLKMVYV